MWFGLLGCADSGFWFCCLFFWFACVSLVWLVFEFGVCGLGLVWVVGYFVGVGWLVFRIFFDLAFFEVW